MSLEREAAREEKMYEQVMDYLDGLDDGDLIEIHNNYCSKHCYTEDYVYPMWMLADRLEGMSGIDVLECIAEDFNIRDEYYKNGIYGIESTDNVLDWIEKEDLADYICFNDDSLGDAELESIIQQVNDEFEDDVEDEAE